MLAALFMSLLQPAPSRADEESKPVQLIFDTDPMLMSDAALAAIGVSEATLSSASGHA